MFQYSGRTLLIQQWPTAVVCLRRYASKGVSCCVTSRPALRPVKPPRYAKVPEAFYGGRHMITLLPGDGIGPEMVNYILKVFDVVKAPIDFEIIPIRPDNYKKDLEFAIMSIGRNGVCIKAGNIEDRNIPHDSPSPNVEIRSQLDLYVSVMQCLSFPNVKGRHKHVDLVVIRQNTEGEYSMLEHENKKGVVESLKIVTRDNCIRIAQWMFKYCIDKRRRKVSIIHKASIMKRTDGLFLDTIMHMARSYPFLDIETQTVDRFCMDVVENTRKYDVIVTTNLYGSVITNTICGLIGGAGLTSSRNYGYNCALFETATRNSAEPLAGLDVANPLAVLHASADALWHLHYEDIAFLIRKAILRSLKENVKTADLGGTYKGSEVVDKIISYLAEDGGSCPIIRHGHIKSKE